MRLEDFRNRFGWRRLAVRDAEIKLWLVDVDQKSAALVSDMTPLSGDEIDRANRFLRAEDRARFMLTRAALRRLLAEETGASPETLAFTLGPFGKPALAGAEALHFSVSHSGALALIGMSSNRLIGVDIELMRENIDELALAQSFFCADEHRFLEGLKGAAQLEAFYRIWTCKEAVLKAFGVGITAHLKDFQVELAPAGPSIRPQRNCFTPALARVQVQSIDVPNAYAATLALA
jgi:4'-phosphopantetheinyl transferase